MRKLLLALCLLLAGCGKQAPAHVDPELAPYFARFVQAIGASADGVSGSFVALKLPTLAQCAIQDGYRAVQVDPTYWATATDDQKEQTILHELGHCALFLQHIPEMDKNFCPISIMNPYAFGNQPCYKDHKDYYYHELASHK